MSNNLRPETMRDIGLVLLPVLICFLSYLRFCWNSWSLTCVTGLDSAVYRIMTTLLFKYLTLSCLTASNTITTIIIINMFVGSVIVTVVVAVAIIFLQRVFCQSSWIITCVAEFLHASYANMLFVLFTYSPDYFIRANETNSF